jgi:hypothetical protein
MKVLFTSLLWIAAVSPAFSQDYGAWRKKNTDGTWTQITESAVNVSSLSKSMPKDITKFCPGYASRTESDRAIFWAGLISIIARPESNFKPESSYTESFPDSQGNKVISRGLLQISIESANQRRYSCGIKKAEDLHEPETNLVCGVKILDAWVKTDNVIATYIGQKPVGGGRYWSTLREKTDAKKNHLPEISKFTSSLSVCTAA